MGEVYLARDTRLGREVAIKLLARHLAEDRDALARFEREARTVSALNHPHIVHIYEIGEAPTAVGQVHYIAMERVAGETLRARLKGGGDWRSLLEPLAQVAEALAKAHDAGVVHRDLKPENVMLTPDGYPKVLDFGLAKVVEPAPSLASGQATASIENRTKSGVIVGTPGYMSPEQVQGKPLDHRSDIFSFGSMLYEVVTRHRPFRGDSSIATLHAIVYEEPPPIESLVPDAPAPLVTLIKRCLAKDPSQRPASIRDVASDLRSALRGPRGVPASPWRRTLGRALVAAGIAGLMIAVALNRRPTSPTAVGGPTAPASVRIEKLTNRGDAGPAAISPDGRYMAYFSYSDGRRTLWLRNVAEKTENRLAEAPAGRAPWAEWSPDGQSIYYGVTTEAQDLLYRVPLIGGTPQLVRSDTYWPYFSPDWKHVALFQAGGALGFLFKIAEVDGGPERDLGRADPAFAAWAPDSKRFLASRLKEGRFQLVILNADGSGERVVSEVAENWEPQEAAWRPDGKAVVCLLKGKGYRLFNLDVASGTLKQLGEGDWEVLSGVTWLPDGTGLVLTSASRFGPDQMFLMSYPDGRVTGIPADAKGYGDASLSADGSRLAATYSSQISSIVVSENGERGPFRKVASGTDVEQWVAWMPDGRLLTSTNEGGSYDLYMSAADGSDRRQLTFDKTANEVQPAPSPDGRYIVFISDKTGTRAVHRIASDGTGLRLLSSPTPGAGTFQGEMHPQVTPDGQWVIYRRWNDGPLLWKVPIDGGTPVLIKGERPPTPPKPIDSAWGAAPSPDGKWIAFFYFSQDSTTLEGSKASIAVSAPDGRIVKTFPYSNTTTPQIGDHQRVEWSADSSTLYYRSWAPPHNVWRQKLAGGTPEQVTTFEDGTADFAWSRDGKRLACVRKSLVSDIVLITDFR
jgi:Tol biopolymer transport system component